jgi:UDP-N-acetylmuramate--alanine ligase
MSPLTPESGRAGARMRRIERVHFIGIGGSGMCGIAEVLLTQGYRVSGSDQSASASTDRLRRMGATVEIGHDRAHVRGADAVVVSTAVPADNPELLEARAARLPVVPRAEMLGELMRYRHGIAVAGTHGKTTTTCMITEIFRAAGTDPTFVVGGLVKSADTNARLGAGNVIVVEADESDASFLYLQPMAAVITNIDRDHMGTYGGDFARLTDAFIEFTHRLPFYGVVAACIDDEGLRATLPRISRPVLTYGFAADAAYRAEGLRVDGLRSRFLVQRPAPAAALEVTLNLPGRHNVLNALAAIAIATDEGIDDAAILAGLANYAGVGRRFDIADTVAIGAARVTLVDDYGHHPTEVKAVIDTARSVWPDRRLVMIYQLHRYTRTRDLFDDFVAVLSQVDVLVLLDVYGAGEAPIAGADARAMAAAIRARGFAAPLHCLGLAEVPEVLARIAVDADVVVTQGAGNVASLSQRLREAGR